MEPRDLFGVGVRLMGLALMVAAALSAVGLLASPGAIIVMAANLTAGSVLFFAAESFVVMAYGAEMPADDEDDDS